MLMSLTDLSSGSVRSCPYPFSTGRFVSSPKCQRSLRGKVGGITALVPARRPALIVPAFIQ